MGNRTIAEEEARPVTGPSTSRWAIASLFLALYPLLHLQIAALFSSYFPLLTVWLVLGCLLPVPAAALCGHVALVRIRRSNGATVGRPMAILGLVLAYGMVALGAGGTLFLFALAKAHGKADSIHCHGNMRRLSQACLSYASDHDGEFPATWNSLYPGYLSEERTLVCPHAMGERWGNEDIDARSDYILIPGRTLNDDPDAVLAICRPGTHDRVYQRETNVVRVDGCVEWIPEGRFDELTRDLRLPPPGEP